MFKYTLYLIIACTYLPTYEHQTQPHHKVHLTEDAISTFRALNNIRTFVHNLLSSFDKSKIDFVLDPRKMSPLPDPSQRQTKQGLRIYFDDRGVPESVAIPWGNVELCGVYFTDKFNFNDAAVIFNRMVKNMNLRLLTDLSCDVISVEGDILPTSVLAYPYEYISSEEAINQWLALNDWYSK